MKYIKYFETFEEYEDWMKNESNAEEVFESEEKICVDVGPKFDEVQGWLEKDRQKDAQ